jgi:membrane-associated phospholipid phosphatase
MQPLDFAIAAVLTVLMILGAYQIYLLPQRRLYFRERNLQTTVDDWIPFRPGWVWIYACAYYPFIVSLVIIADSWERYVYMAFSFAMLLLMHLSIAVLVPVRTPREWREWKSNGSIGERFLRFIQTVDKGGNCFPSMHVAVAMLAGLHITGYLMETGSAAAYVVWIIPLAIAASTVFTKQHYFLDVPAGAVLALIPYGIYLRFL